MTTKVLSRFDPPRNVCQALAYAQQILEYFNSGPPEARNLFDAQSCELAGHILWGNMADCPKDFHYPWRICAMATIKMNDILTIGRTRKMQKRSIKRALAELPPLREWAEQQETAYRERFTAEVLAQVCDVWGMRDDQ